MDTGVRAVDRPTLPAFDFLFGGTRTGGQLIGMNPVDAQSVAQGLVSLMPLGPAKSYATVEEMEADEEPEKGTLAYVEGQTYIKTGVSGDPGWDVFLDFIPGTQFVFATVTGTANALIATPNFPVSAAGRQLIYLQATYENTVTPVTIQFPGLPLLTIKSPTGADIVVGGIKPSMPLVGVVAGSTFRLISDPAAAAIQVAVEEALADTIAARTVAETKASEAAASAALALAAGEAAGVVKFYDTKAAATADLANIAANAIVEVLIDESMGGDRTRYRKESGLLVFKLIMQRSRVISLLTGSVSYAAINRALIQNALNAGGSVFLAGSGSAYFDATLEIGPYTGLGMDDNLELRRKDGFGNMLVSKALGRPWTTVTVSYGSGDPLLEATINWTAHGFSQGDMVWLRGQPGVSPGAYFGVFTVKTVVDANSIKVHLWRVPEGAPAGTYQAKRADRNITVKGTFNYDFTNASNTGAGPSWKTHAVILAGAGNLKVDIETNDVPKFGLCVSGFDCGDIAVRSKVTRSDLLKVYGPARYGSIKQPSGLNGDDVVSFHCMETGAFSSYDFSGGGDILEMTMTGGGNAADQDGHGGRAPTVYADPNFLIDGIHLGKVRFAGSSVDFGAGMQIQSSPGLTGGRVGVITIDDLSIPDFHSNGNGYINVLLDVIVDRIDIDGVNLPKNASSGLGQALLQIAAGSTVKRLNMRGLDGKHKHYLVNIAGTLEEGVLEDSYIDASDGAAQQAWRIQSGATVGRIATRKTKLIGFRGPLLYSAGAANGLIADFDDVHGDYWYLALMSQAGRVRMSRNHTSSGTAGAFVQVVTTLPATAAVTVEDDGGNIATGIAKAIVSGSGGGTWTRHAKSIATTTGP